MMTVFNP